MNYEQELLYTIALTQVPLLNFAHQHLLLDALGSATAIYEQRRQIRDVLPDTHPRIAEALASLDQYLPRAEEEMAFAQKGQIRCLHYKDQDYPARLRECPDAPLLLYYRGSADLNARHVLSMVGTRRATPYGRDLCQRFVGSLSRLCPDALLVSGLAYGIDIHSHRAAVQNGLPTVAVLAHGLDQIYPRHHRDTAIQMLDCGGLLTEFMSGSNLDKKHFIQRNRIVAGLSDATVVVESAAKGGSLITADLANSYNRDVFAFPGRIGDLCSEGCNDLIRRSRAALLTDAPDFLEAMGWATAQLRRDQLAQGIQQDLFPSLGEEEQKIVRSLQEVDEKQINHLSVDTGIPVGQLSSFLFTLEMKGIIQAQAGGKYRLLRR